MTQGKGARKASQKTVEAAEKRAKGLRMLRGGITNWDTIAEQCGWANRGTAYAEVMKELREIPQAEARDYRVLLHERYEAIYLAHIGQAIKRDPFAARTCLDILAAERKMLGLDAPSELRVQVFDDTSADETLGILEAEVARLALDAGEGDGIPREAPTDPGAAS